MRGRTICPADYQALAEFRYQLLCFLSFSERAARAHGVRPRQYQLLLAIQGLPAGRAPSIGVLAERLQLRHHSTIELIDRLERHRLVRRIPSDVDRRQVLIRLTPRGEALLRRLATVHIAEIRSRAPRLVQSLRALLAGAKTGRRRN